MYRIYRMNLVSPANPAKAGVDTVCAVAITATHKINDKIKLVLIGSGMLAVSFYRITGFSG